MRAGAKPERRRLVLGKGRADVRIRPVGLAQAAIVMRGLGDVSIHLLDLRSTRTLDTTPEFRWSAPAPALTYRFVLDDDGGRTVFETELKATVLRLPVGVPLKEGLPYRWKVSASLPDGRTSTSSAQFTIASADLRMLAEALRPEASAALSTRVAYAAWLDQMELKDEARKYWKSAALK